MESATKVSRRGGIVTKSWEIVGKDKEGKVQKLSRKFHSKTAADDYAVLAKTQGYMDVEVRTVMGYDGIDSGARMNKSSTTCGRVTL